MTARSLFGQTAFLERRARWLAGLHLNCRQPLVNTRVCGFSSRIGSGIGTRMCRNLEVSRSEAMLKSSMAVW